MDRVERDALVARAEAEKNRLVGLGFQPRDFARGLRAMFGGDSMQKLKMGDQITVVGREGPFALRTITEVTARQVVDNKGGKWIASSGHSWGSSDSAFYDGPSIRLTEPEDNDRVTNLLARRGLIRVCDEVAKLGLSGSDADLEPYYKAIAVLREVHEKHKAIRAASNPKVAR